jgi:peptidoglycan/LPS O-acetylase OafA/YrhL
VKQDQIPALTGLRFIAAMMVVISHGLPFIVKFDAPPKIIQLLSQTSAEGMTLFFVLSGFVIFLNYSRSIDTAPDLWNFFVARFARLYPLYFIAVAYDLLIAFSYNQFPSDRVVSLPFYISLTQSWLYFPVTGNALVYQFGHLSSVSWSISTEWFFYFAFPFICAAIFTLKSTRNRLIAAATLSIVALTLILTLVQHMGAIQSFGSEHFGPIAATGQDGLYRWVLYFWPGVRVFEFALGCLCAAIFTGLSEPPSDREQKFGAGLTLAAIVSVTGIHWYMFGVADPSFTHWMIQQLHQNFGFAPSMAVLIFCCARYDNWVVRLISGKWIVLGGEASYSIYLLHFLIINAFRYEAATITSWNVALGAFLQLIVVLAAIIGISLVSWTFIEVPARKALRKLLNIESKAITDRAPLQPREVLE